MRIIITKNGQRIIQKLNTSKSASNIFNKNDRENPLMKNYHSIRTSAKTRLPQISYNNSLLLSSNNNIKMVRPKYVPIKKRNLKMPLTFLKRFEQSYEQNNDNILQPINILSNLENKLNTNINNVNNENDITDNNNSKVDIYKTKELNESKNNTNSNIISGLSSSVFLPRIKSHYTLREIMSKSCLEDLDNKLREKLDKETHDLPFDNKIVRNDWNKKDSLKEMDERKNKEIDSRNYNLIEYLMTKKAVTESFIKRINDSNEKKLVILDKLSGKVLNKKQTEKLFDKRMKEKIDIRKSKDSLEFRKILLEIETNVNANLNGANMNKYTLVKNSNKGVYINVFRKFRKKYWKKYDDFGRYFHKYQNVHFEEI